MTQKKRHPILVFDDRVGKMEFTDLLPYGIDPDGLCGDFWGARVVELQNLCRHWPELHIISEFDDRRINRFDASDTMFYLGNGDKDPSLEVSLKFVYKRENFEKALEELLSRPENERNEFDHFLIRITKAVLESDDPFAHSNFRRAMGWE